MTAPGEEPEPPAETAPDDPGEGFDTDVEFADDPAEGFDTEILIETPRERE